MKKIHISTLGCKVNQYESTSFHSSFEKLGHQIVSSDTQSDIVIINTCTVTGKAGAQSRQEIRKALRRNPLAKVIITGCYSQMASDEILSMDELQNRAVAIVGNGDKHLLVDLALQDAAPLTHVQKSLEHISKISDLPVDQRGNRTRAYLRIQDGCNAFCTYCIVPYTRGKSRSLEEAEVLKQAEIYADLGYREVVITGIHVGYYGADLAANIDIAGIMQKLCSSTPSIRYRLSSIEPLEISSQLLDVILQNDNFMPHLHIPLQSGSDDILLRMNRRYTTDQFKKKIDICRETIKHIAIGIDVLAGFPGETEKQFATTYAFLESLDFTYLHVFPYSRRPGTPAADYHDQVHKTVKDERVAILRKLSESKKHAFYDKFLGSTRTVLVEGKKNRQGRLKGFTDNYIPVFFSGHDQLKNTTVRVALEKADSGGVEGKVVQL